MRCVFAAETKPSVIAWAEVDALVDIASEPTEHGTGETPFILTFGLQLSLTATVRCE
jgi:hypothetical protein